MWAKCSTENLTRQQQSKGARQRATPSLKAKQAKEPLRKRVSTTLRVSTSRLKVTGKRLAKEGRARIERSPRAQKAIRAATIQAAKNSQKLDRAVSKAPPAVAKSVEAARLYTPTSIGSFYIDAVKKDPKVQLRYHVGRSLFTNTVLPASVVAGLSPYVAALVKLASYPIGIGLVIVRHYQRSKEAGQDASLVTSSRVVGREYHEHAEKRRAARRVRRKAVLADR